MGFDLDENVKKEVKQNTTKTTKQLEKMWFDIERETILIYGAAKSGKTWTYCSIIKEAIDKGNTAYIINSDGGLVKTLKQFLGDKFKEYAVKMKYFSVNSINDGIKALAEIRKTVKSSDWIFIDLISDFWTLAHNAFVVDASKGKPEEYIIMASKDPKKFGVLEASKWIYCKRLDDSITYDIIRRFDCNIVGVAAQKDVEAGEKISGKIDKDYHLIKVKPAGQKELSYRFDTVILIEGRKDKTYAVIGDRGNKNLNPNRKPYGLNFWKKFKEEER